MLLSHPMRDLLWAVAQHKYGWTHVTRYGGQQQVAEALERRGLVTYMGRKRHDPAISATDAGRAEIARRWPVSPFVLGTYAHQPGGWTPRDAIPLAAPDASSSPRSGQGSKAPGPSVCNRPASVSSSPADAGTSSVSASRRKEAS